nr:protein yippee-like At5g53940 [Ipomoea batatas]
MLASESPKSGHQTCRCFESSCPLLPHSHRQILYCSFSLYFFSFRRWQGEFNQHFISRMGRIFVVDLEGRTYNCKFCKTQLALADDLVSRAFHCRRGKAYLFNNVVNNMVGPLEERMMLSGMHTVADIFCCCCGQIIGWKYVNPPAVSISPLVIAYTASSPISLDTFS